MNQNLENGVTVLDAKFIIEDSTASYLIIEGDAAAFIDTGTNYSVPGFMKYLQEKGLSRDNVQYVILTHIHLDHAGGAGALMEACPSAKLVVHPRGMHHMIHPQKLIESTYAVFGEEHSKQIYGEIKGIPEERVIATTDGMNLDLNGRTLHLFDAPGHAKHHVAIWDKKSRGIFTGDCFGLSYKFFDTAKGPFIFPTTTPIHFDPSAMHQTLDKCLALNPEWLYLTHFGAVGNVPAQAASMHRQIDELVKLTQRLGNEQENRYQKIYDAMGQLIYGELQEHGVKMSYEACLPWLKKDLDLNTQGLIFWWDHARRK